MSEDAHKLPADEAPVALAPEAPAPVAPPAAEKVPTMIPRSEVPEGEPVLLLTDLMSAINVIDTCARRGAFKGDELSSIGAVRDRLVAFVKHNAPKTEEPAPVKPVAA